MTLLRQHDWTRTEHGKLTWSASTVSKLVSDRFVEMHGGLQWCGGLNVPLAAQLRHPDKETFHNLIKVPYSRDSGVSGFRP